MSNNKPQFIQPGAYPTLKGEGVRELRKALKSAGVGMAAKQALAECIPEMRDAVLAHLPKLEAAGSDAAKVYAEAHEIRGLAGNAGLTACSAIATVLCLYLDAMIRAGKPAEPMLIKLCVQAIGRAARAIDDETRLGKDVAKELAALVNRKLAEIAEPSAP